MKYKIIGLIILFVLSLNAKAQSQEDLQNAFVQSYSQENEGKYSEAIQTLVKYYSEDSYEINLRMAWLNYLSGLYTESISYYQRSIHLRPLSIEARLGLTYPAAAVGNWAQVILQYKDILKIAPNNYTANLRLGQIYLSRKEYQAASRYLELLINQYPFTYDVMISTAWNYFYEGKLRKAKILFQKVLLIYPKDESAVLGLSKIK
ncbi:MAG: hypothetical protein DRI84_03035 [Bacteroidetes bacterium]|nr:MAG: hypothetical protein DRI84_03035 [Bacteroidota bacterium]